MAESVVSFVLEKLGDVIVKEVLHLYGVSGQVQKVSRELIRIHSFLKDADSKRIVNEGQKQWLKEVRDLAYWIEDVIDTFLLTVPEKKKGKREVFKRWFKKFRKLPAVHKLGDEIKQIEARFQEIEASKVTYGITNLGEGVERQIEPPARPIVPLDVEEDGIVGFEGHKENILKLLLDEKNKSRSVISIVGIGGLGKTTLARKVYNSESAKKQFERRRRMWVTVSKKIEIIDILRKIAEQLEIKPPNDLSEHHLTNLYHSLAEKKYLLVLDDIWSEDLWNKIKGLLIPNKDNVNGSKILITTRFALVAQVADPKNEPYKLEYLSKEQSIELLMKKALPNRNENDGYPDDLCNIANDLAKKCGYLPLALVVLGGLLSRKLANHSTWSNVLQKLDWGTEGKECIAIIGTSYENLPFALKSCFMYFAAFPEDLEIDATSLLRMWIAEGFIPQQVNKTLEDTAEMYLEDLVQRSMIQVSMRNYDGSIIRCRIHDLLHDLAIRKAREENFMVVFPKVDGARRLAIHDREPSDELMASAVSNMRSLWCRGQAPNVSQFTRLKVLSSSEAADYEPDKFGKLSLLRYVEVSFKVREEDKKSFGEFIGGMRFLQILDLQEMADFEYFDLPDFVWNIKTLRHVFLPRVPPKSLGPPPSIDLPNLQTLSGVKARESWVAQGPPKLPNVKYLWMYVPEAQGRAQWDAIVTLLKTMKHLVFLYLLGPNIPLKIIDMRHFPFRGRLTYLTLIDTKDLVLDDREVRAQSDYPQPLNQIVLDVGMLPENLIDLSFSNIEFSEDPFPVVEMLENLQTLQLKGSKLLLRLCCSAGRYRKLEELFLVDLMGLKEWEIEEGAMPKLKKLYIDGCHGLRLPLGLQYLTVLQDLTWFLRETSATKKNEIRSLCKHVPSLNIYG